MIITAFGWRPSVIGFGGPWDDADTYGYDDTSFDPGDFYSNYESPGYYTPPDTAVELAEEDEILGDVQFPSNYDPFKESIKDTRAEGTDWGEKLLATVFQIGTPALATFVKQQVSEPVKPSGTIVTGPGGKQYQWNAAGQLVPLAPPSPAAIRLAAKATAAAGGATPAWLLPVGIGLAALVLLVAMKRK